MPVTIVGNNTPTAGGVVYGDGTNYASTAAGTAGQFLQSAGSGAPVWAAVPAAIPNLIRSARTTNTIFGTADKGTFVDITSGTFSQTFTAAATLGSGWWLYVRNSGTGTITLDPNASETIDGATTLAMPPNDVRLIQCNGTSFYTIQLRGLAYQEFLASGTWTKPTNTAWIYVEIVGGGGSGGQNGGGGGGAFASKIFRASDVGATVTVTVGLGGTSITVSPATTGNDGGNTTFGSLLTARGGRGGTPTAGGEGGAGDYTVGTSPFKGAGGYGSGQGGVSSGSGPTTGSDGGYSVMGGGGGGGCGTTTGGSGGLSGNGGNGGAGAVGTTTSSNGTNGTVPGGGGGGAGGTSSTSGAGANGRCRVWAW